MISALVKHNELDTHIYTFSQLLESLSDSVTHNKIIPNSDKKYKLSMETAGLKSAPATPNKVVNFSAGKEPRKTREKYLTAKYGSHQMSLIRKRLKVEMWMYDKLQEICKIQV